MTARRRRFYSEQHQQQENHDSAFSFNDCDYDYEDGGNSCGEDENNHNFFNRNRNRHNRRLFRRLNNINHNHLDSNQIIPRQNVRLRSLFDRICQEIDKYRSEFFDS
jgi:hypothetical protein